MKLTKKLFSLFLTLAMLVVMAVPAFAAGDGSIKITNAKKDYTYTAYKILELESYKQKDEVNGVVEEYLYTIADGWEEFFEQSSVSKYLIVGAGGYVKWNDDENKVDGAAEIAKLAMEYVNTKNLTSNYSIKPTADGEATITGLDLGYYLVDTTMGALCSLGTTDKEAEITEKNKESSLEKETLTADKVAGVGSVVKYTITVTVQTGAENYVVHDVMSNGLTFDTNSVNVKVNNIEVAATNYTVIDEQLCENCTFHVEFNNDYIKTLAANTEIVVNYSATINEEAAVLDIVNNTARLEYGDKSYTEWTPTTDNETKLVKFNIIKKEGFTDGEVLTGAQFKLYSDNDKQNLVPLTLKDGVYYVAKEGDEVVDYIEAGNVVIKGLEEKVYYLEETKAPDGYNKIESLITIDLANETFDNPVHTEVVVNKSGTELPSTGGMGTTLFYIGGGAMFIGALVLLVTKKRMKD